MISRLSLGYILLLPIYPLDSMKNTIKNRKVMFSQIWLNSPQFKPQTAYGALMEISEKWLKISTLKI